jgi:isopenicillin-N N-acyltransferase-like protein
MRTAALPVLAVSGTPYEIGCQHGSRFADEIRGFLADHLARINLLRGEALDRAAALAVVGGYLQWIEAELPDLAQEIRGLADGAGISYREAALLQVRRELVLHSADPAAPPQCCDCTSVGCFDATGQAVLAQNVDLAGGMEDLALILQVTPADPAKPRLCMFTFKGLCGYLGVNSAGLAIGLNMVFSRGWRPGVPPYLLIRHLLGLRSLDEVLSELRRIRRASSRYLLVSDGRAIVGIEMTVDDERLLTVPPLVHANHFVHPDLLAEEALDPATLASSRRREETMRRLLASGQSPASILADHGGYPRSICAHNLGTLTRTDTVGSVLLWPASGTLQALAGHPCKGTYVRYAVPEPQAHAA